MQRSTPHFPYIRHKTLKEDVVNLGLELRKENLLLLYEGFLHQIKGKNNVYTKEFVQELYDHINSEYVEYARRGTAYEYTTMKGNRLPGKGPLPPAPEPRKAPTERVPWQPKERRGTNPPPLPEPFQPQESEEELRRRLEQEAQERIELRDRLAREEAEKREMLELMRTRGVGCKASMARMMSLLADRGCPLTPDERAIIAEAEREAVTQSEQMEELRRRVETAEQQAVTCQMAQSGERHEEARRNKEKLKVAVEALSEAEALYEEDKARRARELANLRVQMREMRAANESLQAEKEVCEEARERLKEERDRARQSEVGVSSSQSALQREVETARREVQYANERREAVQEEKREAAEELENVRSELRLLKENSQACERNLEEANAELKRRVRQFRELEESSGDTAMERAQRAHDLDVSLLQESLTERDEELRQVREEKEIAVRSLEALRTEYEERQEAFTRESQRQEEEKDRLKLQVDECERVRGQNALDIFALQQRVVTSQETVAECTTILNEWRGTITTLREELATSRAREEEALALVSRTTSGASGMTEEAERARLALEKRVEDYEVAVQELRESVASFQELVGEEELEKERCQRNYEHLQTQNGVLREEVDALQSRLAEGVIAPEESLAATEERFRLLSQDLSVANAEALANAQRQLSEKVVEVENAERELAEKIVESELCEDRYNTLISIRVASPGPDATLSDSTVALSRKLSSRGFSVNDYLLLSRVDMLTVNDTIRRCQAAPEGLRGAPGLGSPLTFGENFTKEVYDLMATTYANGTNTMRLSFRNGRSERMLALKVGNLYPQTTSEYAAPEMVADIGRNSRYASYEYVSKLDRDLIPAEGTLTLSLYDKETLVRAEKPYPYTLVPPTGDFPYGTESVVLFPDGTRLYAAYVTPSLYQANLLVTPYAL
jgi:hypothetical protein